jgi:hypothetical protein
MNIKTNGTISQIWMSAVMLIYTNQDLNYFKNIHTWNVFYVIFYTDTPETHMEKQ